MRYCFIIMLGIIGYSPLRAQDTVRIKSDWGEYLKHDLFISYNGSPTENSQLQNNYHGIEIGIWRSDVIQYHHPASSAVYFSQELGLSSGKFIHGTKVGGQVAAMLFILGTELTHHTNYQRHSVTISPFLGYGGYPFRLSFAWRLRLTSKDFMPLSRLNVNLSFRIFQLKSLKKRDYQPFR